MSRVAPPNAAMMPTTKPTSPMPSIARGVLTGSEGYSRFWFAVKFLPQLRTLFIPVNRKTQ